MNDGKLIFSPQLANFLLREGFFISKIKHKRDAELEAVFVFDSSPELIEAMGRWNDDNLPKKNDKKKIEAKVIEKIDLANHLISCGFNIIKLKPHRENNRCSVFVFSMDDGLLESMDYWMNN